jgi:maltose O-acetyltransferase
MTEVEKMRNGLLADMSSPELQVRFEHAKKLLARMRGMSTYDEGYRKLLEELVPRIPELRLFVRLSIAIMGTESS